MSRDALHHRQSRLQCNHFAVAAVGGHESFVAADFGDAAVFEDDDAVGVGDRAEPVGDDEARAAFHQRGQAGLDHPFAFGVEVAGGLVEDEDLRVGQDRAGDGDPLPLAAAELHAALADERVVAVGQVRR